MVKEEQRLIIFAADFAHRIVDAVPEQYQEVEGNWYVDPAAVDRERLRLTEHEYHCPYKGRCFYVDYDDGNRRIARVAWIYDEPKPGWEHIKGPYGFYAGAVAAKFDKAKDTLI